MNILCSLVLLTSFASLSIAAHLQSQWRAFKQTHGKSYDASTEGIRLGAFRLNSEFITNHQKDPTKTYTVGHNSLSDLTFEEFLKTRVGGFIEDKEMEGNGTVLNMEHAIGVDLPTMMDWRYLDAVSRVRDQGECNACYAISAAGALEAQVQRVKGELIELSEQNLLDCTAGKGNLGCEGGRMNVAFQYVRKNGINRLDKYPYEGKVGQCRYDASQNQMTGVRFKGFMTILKKKEDDLKRTLAIYGPVSASIDANHRSLQLYTSGIWEEEKCSEQLTHAILIVGYGSENGKDYWIIKNSWGEGWGDKGYFKMARGKNMCGITNMASYPIVDY